MRSIDQLLGDRFFDLLEAAADHACHSLQTLTTLDRRAGNNQGTGTAALKESRGVAADIERKLANTVMASLRKEDIKALSDALVRIAEGADRLGSRLTLVQSKTSNPDLLHLIEPLTAAAERVAGLVRLLRQFDNLSGAERLRSQLREVTEGAEKQTEDVRARVFRSQVDPIDMILITDYLDHVSAIAHLCSECGELTQQIILKYE